MLYLFISRSTKRYAQITTLDTKQIKILPFGRCTAKFESKYASSRSNLLYKKLFYVNKEYTRFSELITKLVSDEFERNEDIIKLTVKLPIYRHDVGINSNSE